MRIGDRPGLLDKNVERFARKEAREISELFGNVLRIGDKTIKGNDRPDSGKSGQ